MWWEERDIKYRFLLNYQIPPLSVTEGNSVTSLSSFGKIVLKPFSHLSAADYLQGFSYTSSVRISLLPLLQFSFGKCLFNYCRQDRNVAYQCHWGMLAKCFGAGQKLKGYLDKKKFAFGFFFFSTYKCSCFQLVLAEIESAMDMEFSLWILWGIFFK